MILHRKIIKSKTNAGQKAKQYFCIYGQQNQDFVLHVCKLVLVERGNCKLYRVTGHKLVKKYKNLRLYEKTFGIKMSTFLEVCNWLNDIAKWAE
jgi:hypothetical protein